MDFPAEVWTNAIIFDGSSEIAYALCVAAYPGNANPQDILESQQGSGPNPGIERLRRAEADLIKAGILAAVDTVTSELFTFYRTADLQKGAKPILSRSAAILQNNQCKLSSREIIKVVDHLQPERSRIHRLLVSAILHLTTSIICRGENYIPLDHNTLLIRIDPKTPERNQTRDQTYESWQFLDLKAQLLVDGTLMLIGNQASSGPFHRISELRQKPKDHILNNPTKVLLGLSGQYARYSGGRLGKLPLTPNTAQSDTPADTDTERLLVCKRATWRTLVEKFIDRLGISLSDDEEWVELDLLVVEVIEDQNMPTESQEGRMGQRTIFWPACYCFITADALKDVASLSLPPINDPFTFVKEWIGSGAGKESNYRKQSLAADGPDMAHGVPAVESQRARRMMSLDGQTAATIYPTPPDGALSHVTPGATDGIAATPGDINRAGLLDRAETNISETEVMQGESTIGTGLYDQDLFRDISGEKFGEAEMAAEPNWDFFDEPDMDGEDDENIMHIDVPPPGGLDAVEDDLAERSPVIDPQTGDSQAEQLAFDGNRDHEWTEKVEAMDMSPTSLQSPKDVQTRSSKLDETPLRPDLVMEKLLQDPSQGYSLSTLGRRSLLSKGDFTPLFRSQLKIADSKYHTSGSFWFDVSEGRSSPDHKSKQATAIPTIGMPKKDKVVKQNQESMDLTLSPPESSSGDSLFNSSELFSDTNQVISPEKRQEGDSVASKSPAEISIDPLQAMAIRVEASRILDLLRPRINEGSQRPWNRSLASCLPVLINQENILTVAQVVADQASQCVFPHIPTRLDSPANPSHLNLSEQLQAVYGTAIEADITQVMQLPRKPEVADKSSGIHDCAAPFIRVSRADASLAALHTIQPFWETLSLQPVNGRKNVTAFCVHPGGKNVEEGSYMFLNRLAETYSNSNLGIHATGSTPKMTKNGLVDWDLQSKGQMYGLLKVCEQLGSSLVGAEPSYENIIIYIVNPFQDQSHFADICAVFVGLFTCYARAVGEKGGREINLQIVPMSFIASPDTLAIPSQAEYLALTLGVYNQCRIHRDSSDVAHSETAVVLAKPTLGQVMLRLASDAARPVSKEDVLHLAYSQSPDLRWINACWTDNLGETSLTMMYCLREKRSQVSRPRREVLKELWGISADIMANCCGRWSLFVAHDGPIDPEEQNEWAYLSNQNVSNGGGGQCELNLLTFDDSPSFQFNASRGRRPRSIAAVAGKHGTPVSTPSAAAMASPEHMTVSTPMPPTPSASGFLAAPTPPEHGSQSQAHGFDSFTDPDVTLVDPADECWALVLNFGLNNSHSSLDHHPARASGFLLKRRGHLDSDGLLALGVNLISTEDSKTPAEERELLTNILQQWRGLYTLTCTKGLGGPHEILPWHVRTAIVGCRAVAAVL